MEYVSKLQQEYVDEYGDLMVAPKPDDGRRRKTFHLADRHELCPAFKALWDRVSTRTLYSVRVDTDDLIKKCVEEINCGMSEKKIGIRVDKVDLDIENGRGVVTKFTNSKLEPINNVFPVPNMVERIAEETNLTRRTVVRILSGIDKLNLVFKNPHGFLTSCTIIIRESMADFLVNGIQYTKTGDSYDMKLFEDEIEAYDDMTIKADNTIYGEVICESEVEKKFATVLKSITGLRLFIKIPRWFAVDTPIGEYHPDWAIVKEGSDESDNTLYLVAETKGTLDRADLRAREAILN